MVWRSHLNFPAAFSVTCVPLETGICSLISLDGKGNLWGARMLCLSVPWVVWEVLSFHKRKDICLSFPVLQCFSNSQELFPFLFTDDGKSNHIIFSLCSCMAAANCNAGFCSWDGTDFTQILFAWLQSESPKHLGWGLWMSPGREKSLGLCG